MVSMKDIAKQCNVSVASVSKALNGYPDISEETRQLILKTASEMGYLPNSSARALKTKRSYNLGVLFVDEAMSGLTHDYFNHVLESFKRTAESKGYDITFTSGNLSGQRLNYYVFDGRIAVVSNNIQGMEDLVSYILKRGHRKIAYIHGEDSSVTRSRLGSFYRTLQKKRIDVPDEYMPVIPYRDAEAAAMATSELLDLKDPPTCILYPDDFSALGGINEIHERGLRIPDDISIAGYDGLTFARILEPRLTTLCQDTETIGRLAAQKLIDLIENPKTTIIDKFTVDGTLFPGASVRNLAK